MMLKEEPRGEGTERQASDIRVDLVLTVLVHLRVRWQLKWASASSGAASH